MGPLGKGTKEPTMISSIGGQFSDTPGADAVYAAMGGNALAFGQAFSHALSQAKTPQDAAKIKWLQAEYGILTDLKNLGSGGSLGLLGGGSMFDMGGLFGVPSWASDMQRLMGSDSNVGQAITAQQQMAFALQSQFNQSLASFGTSGSTFNGLF